ncbi:MAG TPA: ubiquitin-like protein [Gammaproteobacteria bacterium]|jgi:hypothetical protein|nr:ubiquitin-like protein [Gammaproteobacteria bacterium]
MPRYVFTTFNKLVGKDYQQEVISVEYDVGDTVAQVKGKIENIMPVRHGAITLVDPRSGCEIADTDVFHNNHNRREQLQIRQAAIVFFKTQDGLSHQIRIFCHHDTVADVKPRLEQVTGIPAGQQMIVLGGHALNDREILWKNSLSEIEGFHLVRRTRLDDTHFRPAGTAEAVMPTNPVFMWAFLPIYTNLKLRTGVVNDNFLSSLSLNFCGARELNVFVTGLKNRDQKDRERGAEARGRVGGMRYYIACVAIAEAELNALSHSVDRSNDPMEAYISYTNAAGEMVPIPMVPLFGGEYTISAPGAEPIITGLQVNMASGILNNRDVERKKAQFLRVFTGSASNALLGYIMEELSNYDGDPDIKRKVMEVVAYFRSNPTRKLPCEVPCEFSQQSNRQGNLIKALVFSWINDPAKLRMASEDLEQVSIQREQILCSLEGWCSEHDADADVAGPATPRTAALPAEVVGAAAPQPACVMVAPAARAPGGLLHHNFVMFRKERDSWVRYVIPVEYNERDTVAEVKGKIKRKIRESEMQQFVSQSQGGISTLEIALIAGSGQNKKEIADTDIFHDHHTGIIEARQLTVSGPIFRTIAGRSYVDIPICRDRDTVGDVKRRLAIQPNPPVGELRLANAGQMLNEEEIFWTPEMNRRTFIRITRISILDTPTPTPTPTPIATPTASTPKGNFLTRGVVGWFKGKGKGKEAAVAAGASPAPQAVSSAQPAAASTPVAAQPSPAPAPISALPPVVAAAAAPSVTPQPASPAQPVAPSVTAALVSAVPAAPVSAARTFVPAPVGPLPEQLVLRIIRFDKEPDIHVNVSPHRETVGDIKAKIQTATGISVDQQEIITIDKRQLGEITLLRDTDSLSNLEPHSRDKTFFLGSSAPAAAAAPARTGARP